MTVYEGLQEMFKKYGNYAEKTLNLVMPGLDGLAKMKKLMDDLRSNPPKEIEGVKVVCVKDYSDGSVHYTDGKEETMELSGSNVLRFELEDGSTAIVRPSGTEPKVKVYLLVHADTMEECDKAIEKYEKWANGLKD